MTTASAISAPDSEAGKLARALAPLQFDLQLSEDVPTNSTRGQRLWNVIAPDGGFRGQILLSPESS